MDGLLGSFEPRVTVSNGSATLTESFSWAVQPAQLYLAPLPMDTDTEGNAATVALGGLAFDSDSSATILWNVYGLPYGLSMNQSTGQMSGTIALGDGNAGTYTPVITLSDGFSMSSNTFNWVVQSAISKEQTTPSGGKEGATVSLQISATDATSGATLTYSASGLPDGLSIGSSSGLISGTVALGDANAGGLYTPKIVISDGTSSTSESFTLTVGSAISITQTASQSKTEGNSVSLQVSASDATGGMTLTYSASGLPQGLSINRSTGLIAGTIAWGAANGGSTFAPVVAVTDGTSGTSEEIPAE